MLVGAVHYASFCMSKRAALQAANSSSMSSSSSSSKTTNGSAAAADGLTHSGHDESSAVGGPLANLFAAVVGALSTALVESPVELFRHQAQVGMVGNNFLGEMVTAVRKGGPGALYWGFLPYCLESFPYDIAELVGSKSMQTEGCMAAAMEWADAATDSCRHLYSCSCLVFVSQGCMRH